ncbi:MAG: endonuclease III [Gammaproteobacteria bacterium]
MNREKRIAIFERLRAQNPQPATELKYSSPFELLVAVILSAQATDVSVNSSTSELFAVANSPEAIIKLGIRRLKSYIKSIGLYNSKAENIIKTCKMLVEQHNSRVPEDSVSLQALPGVGRKTANVILNTAFGHPTIAVDTHIFRVANRTAIAPGKNVLEVERKLLKLVPKQFRKNAHHWLILHGRYICMARKPKCGECMIRDLCEWRQKSKCRQATVHI